MTWLLIVMISNSFYTPSNSYQSKYGGTNKSTSIESFSITRWHTKKDCEAALKALSRSKLLPRNSAECLKI